VKLVTALLVSGSMALAAAPAVALPPQAGEKAAQGQEHMPAQAQEHQPATPGPSATAEAKRKAYGAYCQDQSKKKAEGQSKSDFAKCVTAMAKAARDESITARAACKSMSKKHTKGEKGTPFSRCRVGVAQLREDDEDSSS
jgi:hypothetical protein